MNSSVTESTVEDAALELFGELGFTVLYGPDIAPGELFAERRTYGDVVLVKRLREALARINPQIPAAAIDDAVRKVLRTESPSLIENNRRFHRFVTDGVPVEYRRDDLPAQAGRIVHDTVWLFDPKELENNDWAAVNQFTVEEEGRNRRPDVVVFVNGLPLAVIELKNLADENATIRNAYNQLQTYKGDIPSLFPSNELLVISDGIEARLGTLTAGWERFMPWRLSEVRDLPHKNLAIETLRKLLSDEIKVRSRKNVVQFRVFSEMLEESIRKYQNRSLQAAEVIQELIELARDMREAHQRGETLGLNEEEMAFYDALETNDSAVKVLGDETLKTIALELLETVRKNTSIDWTVKESVRAKLRVMVKRILRKYGYPPDKQEKATQTVLQQAEQLCKDWAA